MSPRPSTLAELTLHELERAKALVRKVHPDPIDPQIRLGTPEGDLRLAVTLPDDAGGRLAVLALLSDFMALHSAVAFTLASEISEPDAVACFGGSLREAAPVAVLAEIGRQPLGFGPTRWLSSAEIGEDIVRLLPRGARAVTGRRLAEVDDWFGPKGRFPAVRLKAGGVAPR